MEATLDTRLPIKPLTQDAELYKELERIYNAITILQIGIDATLRRTLTFQVATSYSQLVNIGVDGIVRLATTSYPANAFCATLAGVASGATGEVQVGGIIHFNTPLIPGTIYYLNPAVAGGITATKPTYPNPVQPAGFAITASDLFFTPIPWMMSI